MKKVFDNGRLGLKSRWLEVTDDGRLNGNPWGEIERLVFSREGGMRGDRVSYFGNICPVPVQFGDPSRGVEGSPRVVVKGITFTKLVVIASAYLSVFEDCWFLGGLVTLPNLAPELRPSAIDFRSCSVVHDDALPPPSLVLHMADFRWWGGTIERCKLVEFSRGKDTGGGIIRDCRFESDNVMTVKVGDGVRIYPTQATQTVFDMRGSEDSEVVIASSSGSTRILRDPERVVERGSKPWWRLWK